MSQEEHLFSFKTGLHALAGSISGVLAMAILFPFETIRSRVQMDNSKRFTNRSTFTIIYELIQKEGFLTLYRGMMPVLFSLNISNFVYFYIFYGLKTITKQNISNNLVSGSIAGILNVFVSSPMWVVNSRLKMNGIGQIKYEYSGLFDGIFHIAKYEGIFHLWSGLTPSLILISNPAIQFMVYETLKRNLSPNNLSNVHSFVFGAIAKTVATVSTFPLQVIQTRLQYGIQEHYKLSTKTGFINLLLDRLKLHGIKGLFSGLEAKLWQTVLTSAFMFIAYENIVNNLFILTKLK